MGDQTGGVTVADNIKEYFQVIKGLDLLKVAKCYIYNKKVSQR